MLPGTCKGEQRRVGEGSGAKEAGLREVTQGEDLALGGVWGYPISS